jgi:hypothetical protein
MIRAGWLKTGKMVIYPIRDNVDGKAGSSSTGLPRSKRRTARDRDWNRPGKLDDFIGAFDAWHFDWLDVPRYPRERRDDSRVSRWSTRIRCRGGRRDG